MSLDQLLIDQGEAHIGMPVNSIVVMHDDWRDWADHVVYTKPAHYDEHHRIEITLPRTWWQRLLGRFPPKFIFINDHPTVHWVCWQTKDGGLPGFDWHRRCCAIFDHLQSVGWLPR